MKLARWIPPAGRELPQSRIWTLLGSRDGSLWIGTDVGLAHWKFDRFARSVSHLLRALDTFRILGIEFVSLSESLDTATPAGRMVFTVLGAVAELERSLIAERVRAGLRNARAKGKRLGRPRTVVDVPRVSALRAQGLGWKRIANEMGIGVGTLYRLLPAGSKTQGMDC